MYIRLSREDGDKQESESIGNQRKIIERYLVKMEINRKVKVLEIKEKLLKGI